MSEAAQTANPTDARQASMSRVQTQETVLAKLATTEAAKEPPEGKPEGEQGKEGESKPKRTAQERIQELIAKQKDAEAKATAAERKAAELEARMQALQTGAKPIEASDRPIRSKFASEDEYIEALTDWKAKDTLSKREAEQAQARFEAEQAEIAEQWTKRQAKVMKAIPDYAEVVGKSEISVPNHVHAALMEIEQGPEVAYYLCLHPDEAKRIAGMRPITAVNRVLSIARDLAAIEEEDTPRAEPDQDKPAPKKSKAPPPIDVPKSVPSATGSSSSSYEEYKRRREAEKRK